MCRERGLKKKKKTAGMAEEREVRACVERERKRERTQNRYALNSMKY